ncbi:hypothetical protein OUZ56_021475 [Daphnia magna]|uniref:Uncharacterized protein n=1 Tax=Daphnia magna TaxID=35525 RepID=A0ABQ9ZHH0_9CRUS|nr:hypothetical protein OUZ56_021475 [Daphnia magna]
MNQLLHVKKLVKNLGLGKKLGNEEMNSVPTVTKKRGNELILQKRVQPQQTNLDTNEIFTFMKNAKPWMFYCFIGSD